MSYPPPGGPAGGYPGGFPPPPPPGYGGGPPPGWNQRPGWPGGWIPRDHPDAMTVLILGILSIVACPLLGPFAWSKGNDALNDLETQPGVYGGEGSIKAGRICGIIGTVLMVLMVLYFVFVMLLMGSLATMP